MTWSVVASEISGRTRQQKLITFDNKLYGFGQDTRLLQWDEINTWLVKASAISGAPFLFDATVHLDNLYTINNNFVYRWDKVNTFNQITTTVIAGSGFESIQTFNNKLYVGIDALYEWDDVTGLVQVAPAAPSAGDDRFETLKVFNNNLYMATFEGELFEWNKTNAWVLKAPSLSTDKISELVIFNGELHGVTENGGKLLKWNGTNAWVSQNPAAGNKTILCLAVFNNFIYAGAGSANNSRLFKFDSGDWVEVHTFDSSVSNILDLEVFKNKLYGGGV